jgi:hypothetical protein
MGNRRFGLLGHGKGWILGSHYRTTVPEALRGFLLSFVLIDALRNVAFINAITRLAGGPIERLLLSGCFRIY